MNALFQIRLEAGQEHVARHLLLIGILEAAERRQWLDADGNCHPQRSSHVLSMLVGAQKAGEALGLIPDLVPRSFLSLAGGFDPITLIRNALGNIEEMDRHG